MFDPRSVTGIPTEPVGSLPRPQALLDAYAAFAAGRLDQAAVEQAQDDAVRDTLERYRATGAPIVSDGEQRRSSFAAYPVTGSPGAAASPPGDPAVVADGHGRPFRPAGDGPFRYRAYAGDTLARSIRLTTLPMKQPVVSPSTLALLHPPHERTRDQDLVDECERDIRSAFAAGAVRVSVDYSDRRLAGGDDPGPHGGATGRGVGLIRAVLERFTARERMHVGVHTCVPPGSGPGAGPGYLQLLPEILGLDAGYFLLQLAGEPDHDAICAVIGAHLRGDAGGLTPVVHLGVIDTRSPHVESAREVADVLVRAAVHIPAEQLGSTDDCGFSPFSRDPRPLDGLTDLARGIAFRKIRSRVEGTLLAAEKLGFA
ncbi:5-methyltetrahydropteroyltriglutamate--homocysteine methyltransferase [Pseudonocardia nematodicida]|uniref:5-methyltetrahydropteroyltriglutamate--homocysteine methyltransferase n=1 Tax=Pseudonocardia nematodicida TaxID=1206997 RepID=A0ABV1KBF9_9PSEU